MAGVLEDDIGSGGTKREDLLFITLITKMGFLSTKEKVRIYNLFGEAQELSKLKANDFCSIFHRTTRASFNGQESLEVAKREVSIMESKGIKNILFMDDDYPYALKSYNDAPFALFYKGDASCLKAKKILSIVGTRHITPQVTRATQEFVKEAVADGVTIVSGLANGVDGAAHKAVIDAHFDAIEASLPPPKANTVAVLPCCVDTVTPSNHIKLAQNIVSIGGCLISEATPCSRVEKWSFAIRNRIIAALSPATLVMQAPNGSGALITAKFAVEMGRELLFHSAGFGAMEKQIEDNIRNRLQHDFARGFVSKEKLENCCKKYIDEGAPVISSYKNYCQYMEVCNSTKKDRSEEEFF